MSSWEVFAPTVAVAGHWYLLTGNESEVKVEGGRLYDELLEDFMQDFWQKRSAYDRWGTWIFLLLLYSLPLLALVSFCLHRDLRQDLATIRKLLQGHSRALELVGYLASLATGLLARTWPFSAATARLLGISKCLGRCAAAIFTAAQGLHALRRSLSPLDASINGLLWAAQAALHEDQLAGFLALSAALGGLLLLLSHLDPTPLETISDKEVALVPLLRKFCMQLSIASALLTLGCLLYLRGVKYMTLGAMCCGHLTMLLALLGISLGPTEHSVRRQTAVLAVLFTCILAGLIWEANSLRNAGACCVLLWFWVKCLEAPWANMIFKAFVTLGLLQILRQHPDLLDILNPQNLYAE